MAWRALAAAVLVGCLASTAAAGALGGAPSPLHPVAAAVPLPPLPPHTLQARPGPHITADAAVLVDAATGQVLWSKNAGQPRAPASTTKMMTALLALELGNPDDVVTVSPEATNVEGSNAHLHAGERIVLSELLEAMLLKSANDAAVAVAEYLGGTTAAFADLMNARAAELGLLATHFRNPHGLTQPNHYASAYDLALLARAAMAYPTFAALVRSPTGTLQGLSPDETAFVRRLRNTNRLLLTYDWVDGVKTGTTRAAGNCLVASGTRGGQRLIAVVLHSDNRWGDAIQLLEYGYAAYAFVPATRVGELVRTVRVRGGRRPYLGLLAARSLTVPVPAADAGHVHISVALDGPPQAPVAAGQSLGRLTARLGEQTLGGVDLVAAGAVARAPWWWFLLRWLGA